MNPSRFYIPRMGNNIMPLMGVRYLPTRGGVGLFGRIANSLKSFNWSGLLSGANKTLNVVNQTIPLVRQAGPMLNNMKSMLKIARAFGSETTRNNIGNKNNSSNILNKNNENISNNNNNKIIVNEEVSKDNYPNFFV